MSETKLESIRHYRRLTPLLASAGQPEAGQLAWLPTAFDCVINLARADSPHALPDEAQRLAELGLDYVHIPVDFRQPQLRDLAEFFQATETRTAQRLFVHCAYNWRASAFVFLYRVLREQADPAQARADMHAIWQPDPLWQAFIDQALQHYSAT